MRKNLLYISIVLAGMMAALACDRSNKATRNDTPNEGRVRIAGDEAFRSIIASTIATYVDAYRNTSFDTTFTSETEAIQMLLKDSARVVVSTRKFTPEEKKYFEQKTIRPTEVLYAYDAVAIVVNPANPDTAMSVSTLAQILSGKQAKWTSGPMAGQEIVPVFDDPNSSNVNFLRQRLNLKELSPKTTSSGRHAAVIDYVSHTPGAIGVIGVGFISDVDNARSRQFRQDVRIVALSEKEPATEANAYQPYQAYLSQNKYPLRREVYLLSGEYHTGLGTGFISWATSDKGQRIILKSGLLPASMPVRVVDFKKKAAEENTEAE